jgi:predicted DNA-binding transcriptional regulator YafY
MPRAERLLELIEVLRRHRLPVSGKALAAELAISIRTLYRDIATLQAQGAILEGEPGVGYVLRPGFVLPPLMFSADEIEALVLGSRWVINRADPRLALAARNALAKITAVLPADRRDDPQDTALLVGPGHVAGGEVDVAAIRQAIRAERKLTIVYRGAGNAETDRMIWPVALGYFGHVDVVVAWCELRAGFRHFRTDRIVALTPTDIRYPRRRQVLMKEWQANEGITLQ